MKRRLVKKLAKRAGVVVAAQRQLVPPALPVLAAVAPKPAPPPRGVNLVPEGYVGWIRITTPTGRVKVRWVTDDGTVFRDSRCWAGGRFHIERHAATCRVEPCVVVTGLTQDQADVLAQLVSAPALIQPTAPAQVVAGTVRTHDEVLSAGLTGADLHLSHVHRGRQL